ncbi:helix-turn-helix transcriptional regulator [Metabacillus fastidiosus]|uniref:Helix-turn-helix transcriptional regulator n=1 Tax=Metabacillus fastidiosus TaxID=1458 RepID=A0ABU6NSR0_9BACI|nr:helix-turn-helix transcriptional regulator [Metabacillus fastidiosus]
MKLKSNIGHLIKESGLRDDVIREAINVKQAQLRKIKLGESFPSVPKLFKLAKLLNRKVDDLYEEEED